MNDSHPKAKRLSLDLSSQEFRRIRQLFEEGLIEVKSRSHIQRLIESLHIDPGLWKMIKIMS